MRPTTFIFIIQQCLVVLCVNPTNHVPEVQIDHAPVVICSQRLINNEANCSVEWYRLIEPHVFVSPPFRRKTRGQSIWQSILP